MSQPKPEDTYYDVLKADRKATIAEIVAAYHQLKNAFSRDSVATYSLFSADEAKTVIDKLDEAYLTLSNIDKKREYDRWLQERTQNMELPPTMTELERKQNAQHLPKGAETIFPVQATGAKNETQTTVQVADATPIPLNAGDVVTGSMLKSIREKRALSIDDVSRITKIPTKFIRAIEADDLKHLPARVYLQGFVKNLVSLYRLDAAIAVKGYLDHTDKLSAPSSST